MLLDPVPVLIHTVVIERSILSIREMAARAVRECPNGWNVCPSILIGRGLLIPRLKHLVEVWHLDLIHHRLLSKRGARSSPLIGIIRGRINSFKSLLLSISHSIGDISVLTQRELLHNRRWLGKLLAVSGESPRGRDTRLPQLLNLQAQLGCEPRAVPA